MVSITCTQCRTVYYSEESHIGKHLRCARCGSHVPILRADSAVVRRSAAYPTAPSRMTNPDTATPAPRRVRRIGTLAIVSVLVAVGAVSVGAMRHHILAGHRSTNLSEAIEPVDAAPPAALGPQMDTTEGQRAAPADSKPAYYNSLPTGARIEEDIGTNGYGKLTVDNGTDEDAAVRLSATGGDSLRWFFVKAHDSAIVEGIPEGVYTLTFTAGLNWVEPEETFTWQPSYSEFERAFEFSEQRYAEGVRYHSISVTLNPVILGNTRTRAITREEFLKGHSHLALLRP